MHLKCQSKFHNSNGHFRHIPSNKAPQRSDINLIEGAISIDNTGTNFVETKLLIDTGVLIPSGIAVSDLNSANRASVDSSMETVGQLSVRIRFTNLSTIFTGSAVVLKNLSLPVIVGINFLKSISLSPNLDPHSAHIVHSPSKESQDLIANLNERSHSFTKTTRRPVEKSPPFLLEINPPLKIFLSMTKVPLYCS